MKKIFCFIFSVFLTVSVFAQAAAIVTGTTTDLTKTSYFDDNRWSNEIRDTISTFCNVQVAMSTPDYMVTAGDIYHLTYAAGSSAVSYNIMVDSTYKIRVSNLGVIDASGKSYLAVKKQVEEIVTRNYPLSGVQFVLQTPARFKVIIKGEVPKVYEATAWALTRLSTLFFQVATEYSSNRKVTVTNASGISKDYDLFAAQRFGDLTNDPYLAPGDVITVNRADRVVNLNGAVERPGAYQLLPDENLDSLINTYGYGLTISGDPTHIEVARTKTDKSVSGEKIYLDKITNDNEFTLENFDIVTVRSLFDLQTVMFLEGAIGGLSTGENLEASTRVPVQFYKNTNYAYFIRQNKWYFTATVSDRKNAYIIRGTEIIPINIDDVLYDACFNTDLIVQENDTLVVPFKQYFVTVSGAVANPGRYPYIPDRTYDYYIGLAGGFVKGQNARDAVKITDFNGKNLSKADYITPETTILAKTNAGLFYYNQYSQLIISICNLITTVVGLWALFALKGGGAGF